VTGTWVDGALDGGGTAGDEAAGDGN
jgi:hypothetical protein